MSYQLKYIVFGLDGRSVDFMIFPSTVAHSDVARMSQSTRPGLKPLSAGFVSITEKDGETVYQCFGESFTLNLKSRGENDSSFINICNRIG